MQPAPFEAERPRAKGLAALDVFSACAASRCLMVEAPTCPCTPWMPRVALQGCEQIQTEGMTVSGRERLLCSAYPGEAAVHPGLLLLDFRLLEPHE